MITLICEIPIYKLNGTGNDFLLIINDVDLSVELMKELSKKLCNRDTSYGADGFVVLKKIVTEKLVYDIIFFNPDGSQFEICFNAMRCAVKLLSAEFKIKEVLLRTKYGIIKGTVTKTKGIVKVFFTPWFDDISVKVVYTRFSNTPGFFVYHSDPHFVLFDNTLFEKKDMFIEFAKTVRWDLNTFIKGTNVHLIKTISKNSYHIRSFERGIEGETNSCGSGCIATAIIKKPFTKVNFLTKSNNIIEIGYLDNNWWLSGHVEIEYKTTFKLLNNG